MATTKIKIGKNDHPTIISEYQELIHHFYLTYFNSFNQFNIFQ